MNKKYTIDTVKKAALVLGGVCISEKYINANSKLKFKCSKGHRFDLRYKDMVRRNSWCFKCQVEKNKKYTIEEVKKEVLKYGFKCLSKKYLNTKQNIKLVCHKGHKFDAPYGKILAGSGCRQCKNKTQAKLHRIIQQIFPTLNIMANFKGFDWLKTESGGCQELDIWVPELKLAVEYDGEQHFKPVTFGANITKAEAEKRLAARKKLDKRKNRVIKLNKQDVKYFIRFNYKNKIDKKFVVLKLKEIFKQGN